MRKPIKYRNIAANEARWLSSPAIKCHYCGVVMTRAVATKEHLRAKSDGGADDPGNIAWACRSCNLTRGNAPYDAFKAYMLPVKQARAAGQEIPDLPKFQTLKAFPERPRQEKNPGYSQELLLSCIAASRMRNAGHGWAVIADHYGVTVEAARAMATVGGTKPSKRLAAAEALDLLSLIKKT